jgi:hypothetical protein
MIYNVRDHSFTQNSQLPLVTSPKDLLTNTVFDAVFPLKEHQILYASTWFCDLTFNVLD